MAEQTMELNPMSARAGVASESTSAIAEGAGGRSTSPKRPLVRPRQKLPWLVMRETHIKDQEEQDERTKLIDSDPTNDALSTTKLVEPSPRRVPGEIPRSSENQEDTQPLLGSDESEWASSAAVELTEEASRIPSPSLPSVSKEIPEKARGPSIKRPFSRHAGRMSSTPLSDVTYALLGSSEEPSSTANEQSVVPRNQKSTPGLSTSLLLGNKDSRTLKSALDGLEELMNEALRMAEHGVSYGQSHRESPTNSNQRARIARREEYSANATGPLPVSSSSSSKVPSSRSSIPSVPARWWSRPNSRDGVDSPPVSPLEMSRDRMDENVRASEDAGIIRQNPTRQGNRLSSSKGSAQLHLNKSGDSKAIDWAYVPRPLQPNHSPSSRSSDSNKSVVRQAIPVHGPTTPVSILPPKRERVNYLDRKPADEELDDNGRRYYTAPELHQHHFAAGPGRGRRRRGTHHLLPRPATLDEDAQRQDKDHMGVPQQDFVEKIKSPSANQEEHMRSSEDSQQSSSMGPEPEDGKGGLGEVDLDKLNLRMPRRSHYSLLSHQPFSLSRHHRRQLVARDWHTTRKRLTALVACMNTALLGLIVGIYAGEVPAIQYYVADTNHSVILGNVVLYLGMAVTTVIFWPMPLLHGRRRYLLTSLSLAVPLQFPQALSVESYRSPVTPAYRAGLLIPRAFLGLALGFANVNCISVLLDLFGASLQSKFPHQEIVTSFDLRRHGGGLGLWLGFWTWCSIGSLAIGFCIGASIIVKLNPAWGFYLVVILNVFFLLLNVLAPETRRARFRRTVGEFMTEEEQIRRRVARGEIKLHVSQVGPRWWFEELVAGLVLMKRMLDQTGFLVTAVFTGWIYAQIVLVIVLLGALLSRSYVMKASYVGLGVSAIAIGALLAVPLSKANMLSRDRRQGARTDSMTFEHNITWSSHFVRRLVFTTVLPVAAIAYTIVSVVPKMHWMGPIIFAGLVGFLSNLAIAECYGLIMETYDTSDLQPGVNSKHRLQSLPQSARQRRTNYSSYPRVSAGIFATQGLSFLFAAGATGIGGKVTRELGAPLATGIWAAILMGLTVLLALVLWRYKSVRVIPEQAFGTRMGTRTASTAWGANAEDDWKPVIIGNPSGKTRRMNLLELGRQSRWVEIRRLNKLQKD